MINHYNNKPLSQLIGITEKQQKSLSIKILEFYSANCRCPGYLRLLLSKPHHRNMQTASLSNSHISSLTAASQAPAHTRQSKCWIKYLSFRNELLSFFLRWPRCPHWKPQLLSLFLFEITVYLPTLLRRKHSFYLCFAHAHHRGGSSSVLFATFFQ